MHRKKNYENGEIKSLKFLNDFIYVDGEIHDCRFGRFKAVLNRTVPQSVRPMCISVL